MIGFLRWRLHTQETLEPLNLFATRVPLKSGKFARSPRIRRLWPTQPTSAADAGKSSNPRAGVEVANFQVEICAQRILREHLLQHRLGYIVILVNAGVMKLDLQRSRSRIITDRAQTRGIDQPPTHWV